MKRAKFSGTIPRDVVVNVRAGLPEAEYRRLETELMSRLRPFVRMAS